MTRTTLTARVNVNLPGYELVSQREMTWGALGWVSVDVYERKGTRTPEAKRLLKAPEGTEVAQRTALAWKDHGCDVVAVRVP